MRICFNKCFHMSIIQSASSFRAKLIKNVTFTLFKLAQPSLAFTLSDFAWIQSKNILHCLYCIVDYMTNLK